jgi:Domain of unknown function (DUF4352)
MVVDRPTASPGRQRSLLVPVAVGIAVLGVLAVGAWSLLWAFGEEPDAGPGRVALENGLVRVDGVTSAARPGMAMPGMGTDDDPVAAGMRRVSVDVTLQATEDEALEFEVRRFLLQAPGEDAVAPHRSVLPESVLPPGTQLSGTLVFEVPKEATDAELSYDGGDSTEVTLPPEQPGDGPSMTHGPTEH